MQTGRPALMAFDHYSVRTYGGGSGRGVTAVLSQEECSSSSGGPGQLPQIVRDAVKVSFGASASSTFLDARPALEPRVH